MGQRELFTREEHPGRERQDQPESVIRISRVYGSRRELTMPRVQHLAWRPSRAQMELNGLRIEEDWLAGHG